MFKSQFTTEYFHWFQIDYHGNSLIRFQVWGFWIYTMKKNFQDFNQKHLNEKF